MAVVAVGVPNVEECLAVPSSSGQLRNDPRNSGPNCTGNRVSETEENSISFKQLLLFGPPRSRAPDLLQGSQDFFWALLRATR